MLAFLLFSCTTHVAKINLDIADLSFSKDSVRFLTIENTGNANLVIEDFTSSCECTTVNLERVQILIPGEMIKVMIKKNLKEQDSNNTVFVTIKTNAYPRLTSFKFNPLQTAS